MLASQLGSTVWCASSSHSGASHKRSSYARDERLATPDGVEARSVKAGEFRPYGKIRDASRGSVRAMSPSARVADATSHN